MARIGPTSPEFVDTATPSIIGPNKSMGRERGVRQIRSGDRKRPRTSGGGAELDLAAWLVRRGRANNRKQEEANAGHREHSY